MENAKRDKESAYDRMYLCGCPGSTSRTNSQFTEESQTDNRTMDHILQMIHSVEEGGDWPQLYRDLKRDDVCNVIREEKPNVPAAMERLDPAVHTVGCIMLLCVPPSPVLCAEAKYKIS